MYHSVEQTFVGEGRAIRTSAREATSSKENTENLNNIAARDSHHSNTSVIFVCQNLNYGNGKLRNVRINSQYHLMLKTYRIYKI